MNKRSLVKILKILLILIILASLAWYVQHNAAKLRQQDFAFVFHPWMFAFSSLLVLTCFFIQSTIWWIILGGVAVRPPWAETQAIWYTSQVSKYVPGKMMLPLMRFLLLRRRGVTLTKTILSIYIELALMTGSVVLLSLLTAVGWGDDAWNLLAEKINWFGAGRSLKWTVSLLAPAALLGVHPRLMQWIINRGLSLAKKPPVQIEIPYAKMLLLGCLSFLSWVVYSVSCWFLMTAVGVTDVALAYPVAGAFTISWVIGFVSFVTPGGVGVREAILIAMLALWGIPLGLATVAAILARLQWTGMEVVGWGLTVRYRPPSPSRAEWAAAKQGMAGQPGEAGENAAG